MISDDDFRRLEKTIAEFAIRLSAIEKAVCENGRPSLENRMRSFAEGLNADTRKYADERDTHKSNNASQALIQALELMKMDRQRSEEDRKEDRENVKELGEIQDKRHESNLIRFNKLETRMAAAVGAAMVIQVVLQHVWK